MSTPGGPRQSGDAERWAPYPVQDWSTMPPPEPLSDPYGLVDPAWGPPTGSSQPAPAQADPRPRWLPLLVVSLVTVLVGGGLFVADRVARHTSLTAATSYVPSDGQVAYQDRETTLGAQTATSRLVEESATALGAIVTGGLDWKLSAAVLGSVGADRLDRMRFWRTTATEVDNLGTSQQLVRVYRVDGAIELVAESGPSGADIYSPPLVELPADVRPGATWSSEGRVGVRRYRSQYRASAGVPGCLQVIGTVTEASADGRQGPSRTEAKTWCDARGIVTTQAVRGEVTTRVAAGTRPAADPELRTEHEPWVWGDPSRWRRRDFDLMTSDLSLGSGPMTGAPSEVPPVLTASGLVIRTTASGDLVATTPKTLDRWTSLWRMHPGGTVLSVATFGDVVVASTSQRTLVGYSAAGVRLWTVSLDDVAFWAPARVDARRIVVADAAGTVRAIDLLTGQVAWVQRVAGQVSGPIVGGPRVIVVLDASGDVTGLAARTGERLWSRDDLASERAAAFGDLVVFRHEATLEALDLITGRHRWLLSSTGTLDALKPYEDTLVVATQLGTLVVDERGSVVQRLPVYEWVDVVGDTLVGWGRTEAELRTPRWEVLATLDTPDLTLGSPMTPPLPYRQGVMFFGPAWTFSTWSDEP